MPDWIPLVGLAWVAFCTLAAACDGMFNSNTPGVSPSEWPAGAVVGALIGVVTAAVGYSLLRFALFLLS